MRKAIISAVAAIMAGLFLMLNYCMTPSKQVYCYTVDSSGTLYTVAEYNATSGMRIIGGENNADYTVNLEKVIGRGIQYNDIICVGDNVYLLSEGYNGSENVVQVNRFGKDGSHLGPVLALTLDPDYAYYTAAFCETYDYSNNCARLFVTLCTGKTIYLEEIMSDSTAGDPSRYTLGSGNTAIWAGVYGQAVIYLDADRRVHAINNNVNDTTLDIESVNFDSPFMISNLIYGVDLSDVSMSGIALSEDPKSKLVLGGKYMDDLGEINSDTELAPGVRFSDLRKIRYTGWASDGFRYHFLGIQKNGSERGKIYEFNQGGNLVNVFDEPLLPVGRGLLMSGLLAIGVFAAAFLLLWIVERLLALRKVVIKQALISCVLVAVSFCLMLFSSRQLIRGLINNTETSALSDILDYIAEEIDVDSFVENGISDDMMECIRRFEERESSYYGGNKGYFLSHMKTNVSVEFIRVARMVDGEYYYSYYYGKQTPEALASYHTSEKTLNAIKQLDRKQVLVTQSFALDIEWYEVSIPLYDSSGNNVGFLMTGVEYDSLQSSVKNVSVWLTSFWCMILCEICVVFLLFLIKLLSPMKKIKKAVSEISEGRIGTRVTLKTNDELQDIAASFSEMSVKLEKYFNDINLISKAYERYLPKDFFRLMGKGSVLEVSPEDSRDVVLVYLFIAIDMSGVHRAGADGFSALNRIYGLVSMTVSAFGGAVQSLDDRQMTCIFSEDTASAVESALTIREKLTAEGLSDADVRISLQRAKSTIGVIGTGEAMKPVTVSSAIEFNRYISAIMEQFDLSCVITEHVAEALCGVNITTRYIGLMSELCGLSGSRFDIKLYDVPEGCMGEEKQLRLSTLSAFNSGMEAYAQGNTREARSRMIEVLRVNRGDLIARHYMMLCEKQVSLLKENKDELRNN